MIASNALTHKPFSLIGLTAASKPYKLELVTRANPERRAVEQQVRSLYKQHFDAHLKSFFPFILCVRSRSDNAIVAAVGMRYADHEKLFSEHYLPQSVDRIICQREHRIVHRRGVIELGNFVTMRPALATAVIPLIGDYLGRLHADWVVYTLTRPIRQAFHRLNIELNEIGEARAECINNAAADWGRYYDFEPRVYYSAVSDNLRRLQHSELLV